MPPLPPSSILYPPSSPLTRRAFTLIELLVTLGILTILTALLLPAIAAARRASRTTLCASNLRQLATALIHYAQDYNGSFPPNSGEIQQFWYKKSAIGRYLPSPIPMPDDTIAGGVLVCPSDEPDAIRSYSMNLFASSYVSSYVQADLDGPRPPGKLFKFGTKSSSSLILAADSWADLAQPDGSPNPVGYAPQAIMGFTGLPGSRFGAGYGVGWSIGRFGTRASQIAFYRHRHLPNRSITDPDGAANFAFVDGHVSLLASKDLADFDTSKSRYLALWSEIDREIE